MRFNPDYFEPSEELEEVALEDLLEGKSRTIDNLSDLPDEHLEQLEELRTRINEMTAHEEKIKPERDGSVTYAAFQELQIMHLQQEVKQIHGMLLMLAKAIDSKRDKDGEAK